MDSFEVLEKKQDSQNGAEGFLSASMRRVLVYVAVLLATAALAWSLIQGDERDLWSDASIGFHLVSSDAVTSVTS